MLKTLWYNREYDASWTNKNPNDHWIVYDINPDFSDNKKLRDMNSDEFLDYYREHVKGAFNTKLEALTFIRKNNCRASHFENVVW